MTREGEGVNHGKTREREKGCAVLLSVAIDIGDMVAVRGDWGVNLTEKVK